MANVNNKNEYFSGAKIFEEITRTNNKNFDFFGSDDSNDWLILDQLSSGGDDVKDNPNFFYYGGDGVDGLEYVGSTDDEEYDGVIQAVTLEVSDKDGFDFKLTGGYYRGFDSLDVYTDSVSQFNLTGRDDTINLAGSDVGILVETEGGKDYLEMSEDTDIVYAGSGKDTVYGNGGHDDLYGGDGADDIWGGDGNDYIYGEDGHDYLSGDADNDYIDGGDGDDTILGGEGDDTLVANSGADVAYGGTGEDVFYATANIGNETGTTYLYGDMKEVNEGDHSSWEYIGGNDAYNQADTFFITSDTGISPDFGGQGNSSSVWGDTAMLVGQTIIGELPGGTLTNLAIDLAILHSDSAAEDGIDAEGGDVTENLSDNIQILDFDAWGDTVMISLDDHAGDVYTQIVDSLNSGSVITFGAGQDLDFLSIGLATEQLSWMAEGTDGLAVADYADEFLANLRLNSMVVGRNDNGDTFAYSLNGIDWYDQLDNAGQAQVDAMAAQGEQGSADGVWVLGDFGNSVMYGDGKALAGTNSSNVMYSGKYTNSTNGSDGTHFVQDWFSTDAAVMVGGYGDDIIFGSTGSGDKLYGNGDDDYLVTLGASDTGVDYLYGGTGYDTASFESVYSGLDTNTFLMQQVGGYHSDNNGATAYHGVYVDLGLNDPAAYILNSSGHETHYDAATIDGTTLGLTGQGDKVAELDSIEALVGSDQGDVLIGDGSNNMLYGKGGDDVIIGGGGDDTVAGGDGNDVFVVSEQPSYSLTNIEDFSAGDTLLLDGLSDTQVKQAFVVDYGNHVVFDNTVVYLQDFDISNAIREVHQRADGTYDVTFSASHDNLTDSLNVTTSQSSGWDFDREANPDFAAQTDYLADNVLDGNVNTYSSSNYNDSTPWISLDMGQDVWIDHVDVTNRYSDESIQWFYLNDNLQDAKVQILDDGQVVWESSYLANDIQQSVTTNGVIGDEVRLMQEDDFLHVAEVDVYGKAFDPDEYTNLTDEMANVSVVQSTLYQNNSSYIADMVLDGDVDTFNHTAWSDAAPSLTVDLGDDALIQMIDIANRNDAGYEDILNLRLEGAVVQVLDDGEVIWESNELTSQVDQFMYTGGVVGDQVRIKHEAGNYLHIAEIDIYGTTDEFIF